MADRMTPDTRTTENPEPRTCPICSGPVTITPQKYGPPKIEAEAAQGAAPRAEGLDVERPMPFVQRVWPPFTNRDQELAQAFREAVAQAHYQATDHPVFPHPLVEDDDYNCPNEWCQRMWAMVREAEDRARLSRPSDERVPLPRTPGEEDQR